MNGEGTFDSSILRDSIFGSKYFNPEYLFDKEVGVWNFLINFVTDPRTLETYRTILFALSLFFLAVISYTVIRLLEVRRKEREYLQHEITEYAHHQAEKEQKAGEDTAVSKNEQWRMVLNLLFSQSSNDWKLSLMEADSMLDKMLGELGYKGETLGDKLKNAGEKGFKQISNAWEAHNTRNRIAHEGSVFELSHYEAKRVIALYEQIFREFGYI